MIKLDKIPSSPGCYIYKDKDNNIIYIGKAKNLKKRVLSYFQNKEQDVKTKALVSNIYSVDFILTNNELDAFILENTLIKKHKPKYNIDLKNAQKYAYIQITKENYPKLLTLRNKPVGKEENVFGPFVSGQSRVEIIKYLNKEFKLRTCKHLPKKPCTRFHIGYCSAPCINNITKEEYNETIEIVKKILSGKIQEILPSLKKEMEIYSKEQNFEKALVLREQIHAIEYLKQKQNVERQISYNEDIINFILKDNQYYILLFNINKGALINKKEFILNSSLIDISVMDDFLIKYYSDNFIPEEIIIPTNILEDTKKYLASLKKKKIIFTVPKKGEKKELLELCLKNIEYSFFKEEMTLLELQKKLKLKKIPETIECFDVSHFSGSYTVGSMVSFKNGMEDKKNYRRFKIKTLKEGKIDDVKSIFEIVKRRYSRLLKENKQLPDLIVIDGGKTQLFSAINGLKELNIFERVDIISLAEKNEEIFKPEEMFSIKLNKKEQTLHLLQKIRDEAHRFAISYHKLLRQKSFEKNK